MFGLRSSQFRFQFGLGGLQFKLVLASREREAMKAKACGAESKREKDYSQAKD